MYKSGVKSDVPVFKGTVVTMSVGLGWSEVFVSGVGRAADDAGEDNTDSKNKFNIAPILNCFERYNPETGRKGSTCTAVLVGLG